MLGELKPKEPKGSFCRYVSHNGLEKLEGVEHLTLLNTLDIANNRSRNALSKRRFDI